MVLLSAGCHVTERDNELMNSEELRPVLEPRGVLAYAALVSDRPASLKRLCKLAVRSSARKPLAAHVPRMELPAVLQKYLLLEITD